MDSIYCSQCGSTNDPNAFRCVSCGEVIQRAGGPGAGPQQNVPSHLVWSILVTIFCCTFTGIPAIVFSAISMSKSGSGDYEEARKAAKTASVWCWVSFGIGLTWILAYSGMMVLAALSTNSYGP